MSQPLLLFVGSPLLDVTSSEDGSDLLRRYGLKSDGCVAATERHDPLLRELFEDPSSRMDAGGSALNSAVIASWALGNREGTVAFAGCVGSDEYARRLEFELKRGGVEPLFVTLADRPTGVCACVLSPDRGSRSMVTWHGAAACFSEEHLREESIRRWRMTSRGVFVVGYFAGHSPGVLRALAEGRLPGQLFSLSLSAEYVCRNFTNLLLSVLPEVDILFGNEAEVLAFAEAAGLPDASTVERAAVALATIPRSRIRDPARVMVVSRGTEPVIMARGAELLLSFPIPAPESGVVETVGCGDALAGAFLAVYVTTGGDLELSVRAGIRAALEIAQVPGCCPPDKTLTT